MRLCRCYYLAEERVEEEMALGLLDSANDFVGNPAANSRAIWRWAFKRDEELSEDVGIEKLSESAV